ncbi:MAG: D-Ala-D-Ala dipeptidase [Micavibrio aeruginosavorus]|uniref:D-Ala-D-Ala dipeptidase n=1 Tax=Micavibrio aeruginosavorus TaxID=349221 RepID=A0A7T5R314_9BACT|nr:MAG: D-Ala-D-Ala dipeptidase [Micavibrio aeruginosavorus]
MNTPALQPIDPHDLVPMDLLIADYPLLVDVMYAGSGSFCGPVYRPAARLSLHRHMAEIVLVAARLLFERTGAQLELYDGLRTTTVQRLICETPIVRAHPHWTAEGPLRMFAPPGKGGHPRGMAIDLSIRGADGALFDMGTTVDALPEGGADATHNPAHREYARLDEAIQRNRDCLTNCLLEAAGFLGKPLKPLITEWWDYRFPDEVYNLYAPLADEDVPPALRLSNEVPEDQGCPEFPDGHYGALAEIVSQTASRYIR